MNELQVFNHENLEIRTTLINGEIWFVAKDICDALDIVNSRDAIARLDEDEKGVAKTDTLGGGQQMSIINESGLYSLVLTSNKPEAKKFKKWVTSEVLPSIRKTGQYLNTQPKELSRLEILEIALESEKKLIEAQKQLEAQKDDVEFAQQLKDTTNSLDFATAAKAMKLGYGRNLLFKQCRDLKILNSKNLPYQDFVDKNYFVVVESSFVHPKSGDRVLTTKTMITAKGQQWLLKQLNKNVKELSVGV